MEQRSKVIALGIAERLPQWLRSDLAASDPAVRMRAEETLAAIIADAFGSAFPAAA